LSDDRILTIGLLASGLIPFTLLGGWGPIGDHSLLPRTVGFGTQAGFVLGVIGHRRGWWNTSRAALSFWSVNSVDDGRNQL
jgi:hypothetical protein